MVIRGKIEHGGKMEHRVFSVIHRNQTCNRPRFEYRTKCHPFNKSIYSRLDINCLLLNTIMYLFFACSHHLIEQRMILQLTKCVFSKLNLEGKIKPGMLGQRQNGIVGQNGTGQNGTIPSYPKCVSFCPNTLVRFTPCPFYLRKF